LNCRLDIRKEKQTKEEREAKKVISEETRKSKDTK
jgi:hypothetical protein